MTGVITLDPDRDPWDHQPGEPDSAYAHFQHHLEAGRSRRLTKTAQNLTLTYQWVKEMAYRYQWTRRARAYDQHRHAQAHHEWLEIRRAVARQDARTLHTMVQKVSERLESIDADELSPGEAARWVDIALKHRRLLHGDPTENIAVSSAGDGEGDEALDAFAAMAPDERQRQLRDMVERARRRVRWDDEDDDELDQEHGDQEGVGNVQDEQQDQVDGDAGDNADDVVDAAEAGQTDTAHVDTDDGEDTSGNPS